MRTTGPGQSSLLLLDAVSILDRLGTRYAVVGALAAAFHGAVRASLDADALLFLKETTIEALEREFKKDGFRTLVRRGEAEDPISAVLQLTDDHENRVDLLAGIRGMDPAASQRTVQADYEGTAIRIVGLEDFIAMKLYAGGATDVEDARRALAVSRGSANVQLLEQLAARFGRDVTEVLKKLLSEEGTPPADR